jgi:hypothetical protein
MLGIYHREEEVGCIGNRRSYFAFALMAGPPSYRRLRTTPPGSKAATVISAWLPDLSAYLPACELPTLSPVVPASALP